MSKSPFEIFRRNLKPLMVLLTLLALFAFVVLPAVESYLRRGPAAGGADAVVASFDGTPIRRSRVQYFTRNHQAIVGFLTDLAQETIARGGVPRTPGFQYDSETNQIRSLGIEARPSEEMSIRTLQWASQAQKAGFELDNAAIRAWLIDFTDGLLSDDEIIYRLVQNTGLGRYHLYDQLRNHLLADLYIRSARSGLASGNVPLATPAEQWDNFLKLNRQATVDAYSVLVADHFGDTDPNPSEATIREVFEEGKERFPNPDTPEFGFRRPYTATIETVAGNLNTFIDRVAEEFAEEKLRAEYQRRLEGGDFRMPAEDDGETQAGASQQGPAEGEPDAADEGPAEPEAATPEAAEAATPEAEMPDDGDPNDTPDAEGDAAANREDAADPPQPSDSPQTPENEAADEEMPADGEANETPQPAGDATDSNEAAESPAPQDDDPSDGNEQPADGEPSDEPNAEPADTESPEDQPESPDEEPESPSEEDEASFGGAPRLRFVALQDAESESESEDEADGGSADDDATPQAEPEATDGRKGETPDDTDDGGDEEAEPTEPNAAAADDAKMQPAEDAGPTADQPEPGAEADAPDAGGGPDAGADAEPEVKSFEEVRNQIADDLARDEAVRLRDTAIEEVEKAMKRYFQELAIFESQLAVDAVEPGDRPVKPDLQALAEEYGLQYRLISENSRGEIDDDPIAGSVQPGESPAQQRPDFTSMMYGLETRQQFIPRQPLFSPIRTVAVQTSTTYVAWKIDETEAYVPELDEAREEVIEAVRTQEARELARAAAEEIAVEANGAEDAPLTQFVPERKQELIRRDLGPFSWMNTFGFMQATIGNVPQLDDVGDQFMRAVFNAESGQHVVAPNRRESVFYVVKPTNFQPPIEELRERFLQPQERMMALLIESEDMSRLTNGFFEALDERTGFEWPEAEQP